MSHRNVIELRNMYHCSLLVRNHLKTSFLFLPVSGMVLLFSASDSYGQSKSTIEAEIYFSGDYDHVTFELFAEDLENKVEVHFKFKTEWIEEVFVTARGMNLIQPTEPVIT